MTKIDLESVVLNIGSHESPEHGMCLLEVVSLFAGEDFGDSPACVDPTLAKFGRSWNDGMRSDAERAQLKQYITRLPGTNKGSALSKKRGWMALDWLIRVHTAEWLALNPCLVHHAETLKMLPPITCSADLVAAQLKIDAAKKDATAVRDAAWDAARAAVRAAAGVAAWDAAWDAARAAEWTAARAAAKAKLDPTVVELQTSAHDLFSRMIEATE